MFENDSIHSFQRSTPKRTKAKGTTSAVKQSKDDFIMDTNNSSIVSKRSVEKLYWQGQSEYFRYFVSKFKRRSPLINRGYWLRIRAVKTAVENFLKEPAKKHKLVVNLGCGYDPLPWLFFGKRPHLCDNATFVDVDYPPLMQKKLRMIQATSQLQDLLPELKINDHKDGVLCRSNNYAAVGCDLRNLDFLRFVLQEQMSIDTCKVAIIFVAEVSIAYMDYDGSQAVLQWASSYDDVRFCLLEQHLPDGRDHPFAETMLKHFTKLRTPLTAIGTMSEMKSRFVQAGWPKAGVDIRSLWTLWSDDDWISAAERKSLDAIEPFDEWEEFALFASHYFLLVATKPAMNDKEHKQSCLIGSQDAQTPRPIIVHKPLTTATCQRRFAAVIPASGTERSFAIHAGLGAKERQNDSISFTATAEALVVSGPPLLNGLMCHTVTRLNVEGDCLLIGGRRSPSESSDRCWLRRMNLWTEVEPLPQGRFRHSSIAIKGDAGHAFVVVFGGKHSDGSIARDALAWRENEGWTALSAETDVPTPRFGAVVLQDQDDERTGLVFGGMSDDGVVLKDIWHWRLASMTEVTYERLDDQALRRMNIELPDLLWRFGAQATSWKAADGAMNRILVGGVGAQMLTRDTEVVDLNTFTAMPLSGDRRPLLIGMSLFEDLCLGGGATCFSFGTCWSEDVRFEISDSSSSSETWRILQRDQSENAQTLPVQQNAVGKLEETARLSTVPEASATDFRHSVAKRKPQVMRHCDLGDCVQKWSIEYLQDQIGQEREVSVHVATRSKMDFASKNFSYAKMTFGDFVHKLNEGEMLYLRALSTDAPSNEPTFLDKDFPSIAQDFHLPAEFNEAVAGIHSSPLRISGRVTMWLHYDVMANVLCQIRGRKRLMLFPPTDVVHLGFEAGASSSSFDAFDKSPATQTTLSRCQVQEVLLEPGDVLYIPPLWLHTAEPTEDISIAVNVFFRDLQSGYAAGRDVYGNRDVAAYERARKEISKIAQSFADLPSDMGRFYLERLAAELASLAHSR